MGRYNQNFPYKGITYRSKFEMEIAKQLHACGMKFKYEQYSYQFGVRIPNCVCATCGGKVVERIRWYTPDFFLSNGVVIEAKGRFTGDDRKKLLAVRAEHPNLDVRLIFQRDNTLSKGSKTRYSEWCRKNDFMYSIKEVPEEWLS